MRLVLVAVAVAALGWAAPARAETYLGFSIGISNAPPPPVVVFRSEPRLVFIADTKVYMVSSTYPDLDYDMFRSGKHWYVCRRGHWYKAKDYRGPYKVIDARNVPRGVLMVPAKKWRHHPHAAKYAATKAKAKMKAAGHADHGPHDHGKKGDKH